ncbi:MAG TPA: helix-turn-helix transcriptional regulator [Labilithrix sp.]|nr:helix-turn-helix transcriptional regulator [Labilithrix sp.]
MGTGSAEQKLRVVDDLLATYSLQEDNLRGAMGALRELLDTDKVFVCSFGQRGDGDDLTLTRGVLAGSSSVPWGPVMDDFIAGRGVEWAGFNPVRPDPVQRNRVLTCREIDALTDGVATQVRSELYARLGVRGFHAMRVLVCDDASLLAWVGILQPTPADERQRALFEKVVPALRRRLEFDRLVGHALLADPALVVALDAIPAATWLVGPRREIRHANAAGHARLDADRAATYAALVEATVTPASSSRFKVAAVRGASTTAYIVVENAAVCDGATEVFDGVKRLGLTPAQGRVFEHVVAGSSNATIAAELGVAERTVEAHVTAILVKAQVSSRAALIVQMFRGQRARLAR